MPQDGHVCRKGEAVDDWIGAIDSLLKMGSVSPAGKIITFTGVLGGAWLGEGSLLKDGPRIEAAALGGLRPRVPYIPVA
jgi:CRP/FNR family cyclic AMP-dependent transcriptional regulator